MGKISLIIQREYLTRVKKKSFIVMTILGPLLLGAVAIIPAWLAMHSDSAQQVVVIDDTYSMVGQLPETDNIKFFYEPSTNLDSAEQQMLRGKYSSLLYIPATAFETTQGIQLKYKKQPGVNTIMHIEKSIQDILVEDKLKASGIDKNLIEKTKKDCKVNLITKKINDQGEEKTDKTEASMFVGFIGGILIYMFIFLYGA